MFPVPRPQLQRRPRNRPAVSLTTRTCPRTSDGLVHGGGPTAIQNLSMAADAAASSTATSHNRPRASFAGQPAPRQRPLAPRPSHEASTVDARPSPFSLWTALRPPSRQRALRGPISFPVGTNARLSHTLQILSLKITTHPPLHNF